jgi:hypothetical protein
MTTMKQKAANKRNAQKSTGPKTTQGLDSSKMNALKHGLTADQITLPDELPADFEASHQAWVLALKPADELEEQLVERVAISSWRLRRVYRIEVLLYERKQDGMEIMMRDAGDDDTLEAAFRRLVKSNTINTLSRYEAGIERSLYRALHELERVQARRMGQPVATPLAVDVTIVGGAEPHATAGKEEIRQDVSFDPYSAIIIPAE